MSVVIYHNPRCTKSRETLKLIEAQGIKPQIVEYLKTPPSVEQLKQFTMLLGMSPRELLRTKEEEYKRAGLDDPTLPDAEILACMHEYPVLMERPIVVVDGKKAAIGRPPENVLKIIK